MHILKCIICVKEVPRSDMIGHIAEELNYFRFHCNGCCFKTSYSHAIVEHELETSHSKKDVVNQYLDRLCNIVYSDCVLKEKSGIDAVFSRAFQPSAIARTSVQNDVASMTESFQNSHVPSAVSSSAKLFEARSGETNINNGEWMIVGDRNERGDAENGCGASHELSAKSLNTASRSKSKPAAKKSKTPTTRCRSNSNVGSTYVDMECPSAAPITGEVSQSCRRCHCVIPNDYRSHKEHVKKMHADGNGDGTAHIESEIMVTAHHIKQCFPNAVAVNDFQCTMCGKELRSPSGRRWHVATNHLFICLACPKRTCAAQFGTMKLLEDHVKAKHKNDDLLTANEQTILKDTRDDHNAKLKLVMSQCFPFPVPTADETVDSLLSHSANIPRPADEEEEDVDQKDTNSHISAAHNSDSESVGGVAPPVAVHHQPVVETLLRSTESSSGLRSRRFSSSSNSSVESPTEARTPISSHLKNIKREIKEEKVEEERKANKRQRTGSNSDSSLDADERRLKIFQLVDDIHKQEAKRRNGLLLNPPSKSNKSNVMSKAANKEEESLSSASSSSGNDEVQQHSVPRRVLPKTSIRPSEPAATSLAASSNSNGGFSKEAVHWKSYNGNGQSPIKLAEKNSDISSLKKVNKGNSGKNSSISNTNGNGKTGGFNKAVIDKDNVSKPKKDYFPQNRSSKAKRRVPKESIARNNNNGNSSGQQRRSLSVKRLDGFANTHLRDHHRHSRNPEQRSRDVPYMHSGGERGLWLPLSRSPSTVYPCGSRTLLPTPQHVYPSPPMHVMLSSLGSEYRHHVERRWDDDHQTHYTAMPSNTV